LRVFPGRRIAALIGLFASTVGAPVTARAGARDGPLQIDEIFAHEPLIGRLPASITWAPDGSRFLYTLPAGESGPLDTRVYDVRSHRARIFFRAAAEGKGARPAPEFVWSPDSRQLAYLDAGALWVIGATGTGRRQLASDADDPQWSPDSRRIAYVHANDVYTVFARGGMPTRLSYDGSPVVSNGDPDWAYSEELGMRHAFAWSPDGTRIAYLQFDERPIAPFPIVDFLPPNNRVDVQRYPLAGQPNSIVSLRVATLGGSTRERYSNRATDEYVASIGWAPDGRVVASILDRAQRHLRYIAFDRGASERIEAESDARWIDFHGAPRWLHDGRRVLFLSDRDGQTALYVTDVGTHRTTRLTHGFAVSSVAGVDEALHVAFVQAAYPTRRDSTVLMIPLRGGIPRPLAGGGGAHDFFMAPNARAFVRADSAFGVPPAFTIGSTLGGGLVPFAGGASLAGREFGGFTLGRIDSPQGPLDTFTIKPPGFDPAKRYPVIMDVYGGPASPTTENRWGGLTYLFHQALAQRGFIVFSVDGAASQIDSAAAVRSMYHRLGPAMLTGQLAGARFLASLPYVDPQRIGIWGWSFGGYATAFALTHAPGVWKAGIAVAPVTDWRYYDTIYTERYMGTPARNPAAYQGSSVVRAAAGFSGRLLIAHGTADDNVHFANSIALLQALSLNGKHADFLVYAGQKHGIGGLAQRRHLFAQMLDYWREHL
jgi:dipeptidyl-peptidase-4